MRKILRSIFTAAILLSTSATAAQAVPMPTSAQLYQRWSTLGRNSHTTFTLGSRVIVPRQSKAALDFVKLEAVDGAMNNRRAMIRLIREELSGVNRFPPVTALNPWTLQPFTGSEIDAVLVVMQRLLEEDDVSHQGIAHIMTNDRRFLRMMRTCLVTRIGEKEADAQAVVDQLGELRTAIMARDDDEFELDRER